MKPQIISKVRLALTTLFAIGFLTVVAIGEYHIFYKKSEYTKTYYGTVLHSYESSGRTSSTCFATIRFDVDNSIDEVNTGHYLYKPGDRFSGNLSWDPIMGVTGIAYSWHPKGIYVYTMIAALFNILCIIVFIFWLGYFLLFYKKENKDEN